MTVSQYYEYSFLSLICLGLFVHNHINMRNYGHHTLSGQYMLRCVRAVILSCVLEIIYGLREAGVLGSSNALGYIEEILYTITIVFAGYFWYIASDLYQKSPMTATKARRAVVSVPLLVMVVVVALTPLHHLNFYFENGRYISGPLSTVFALVMYVFIIGTGISALVKSFRKQFYLERGYFRIIFLYAVILVLFQALQIAFGSVMPFRTMGAALVFHIIQQKYIKENIYIDKMTGADNRNSADKYLYDHIEDAEAGLAVAMIDIDRFKEINDTYGHAAGDRALQLLAEAFMTNLESDTFFARYGGDEFLLINTAGDTQAIEKTFRSARQTLNELCLQAGIGFSLDFSYGITIKTPQTKTIPDILQAADARMYKSKREKNAARLH